MIVIVFWAIENNLVYLREDRSDCDKFLPGRHIVVIFFIKTNFTCITNNRVPNLHIVHLVRCNSELYLT